VQHRRTPPHGSVVERVQVSKDTLGEFNAPSHACRGASEAFGQRHGPARRNILITLTDGFAYFRVFCRIRFEIVSTGRPLLQRIESRSRGLLAGGGQLRGEGVRDVERDLHGDTIANRVMA